MKKVFTKLNMAIIAAMVATPAMAAPVDNGLCQLLIKMHDVFALLRTLAFVGAAFVIAGWAWGYISKGEVKLDDLQKKGTGMLVGFILLFGIGVVLSFFMSQGGMASIGCQSVLRGW